MLLSERFDATFRLGCCGQGDAGVNDADVASGNASSECQVPSGRAVDDNFVQTFEGRAPECAVNPVICGDVEANPGPSEKLNNGFNISFRC